MNDNPFDVVILGGGPAGTSTALALRRHAPNLSIGLVERFDGQTPRIGETLPPGVRPLLEQLGVWTTFQQASHLPAYGTKVSWGTSELVDSDFLFSARGNGWHLDRQRFDAMLIAETCNAGVTVLQPYRVTAVEELPGGPWRLQCCSGESAATWTARFVVDATGRSAWFARRFGRAAPILFDDLVGVFRFFRSRSGQRVTNRATLIESAVNGYWYGALLPDDKIAVAFMTDADVAQREQLKSESHWSEALSRTTYCSQFLQDAEPIAPTSIRPARSQRLDRVCTDTWLAVGDAASAVDPLSSQGILKALRSGIFAAYAIADQLLGRPGGLTRFDRFVRGEFERYLETKNDYYTQESRWPQSSFWIRRQETISLDPFSTLVASRREDVEFPRATMHLTHQDMHILRDLCRVPMPANQIVSAFKHQRPSAAGDQRIILALQFLIQSGLISSEPQESNKVQGVTSR